MPARKINSILPFTKKYIICVAIVVWVPDHSQVFKAYHQTRLDPIYEYWAWWCLISFWWLIQMVDAWRGQTNFYRICPVNKMNCYEDMKSNRKGKCHKINSLECHKTINLECLKAYSLKRVLFLSINGNDGRCPHMVGDQYSLAPNMAGNGH